MYHAYHSRILGFLLFLVSYIGLQKNLSTVGYEMTTRFFYIICVIVLFLVLSCMVQSQTFIEDQKLQKQIRYSRYFAYPFEISHRKRTRFFKKCFSGVWVHGFYPVSQEQSDTYSYKF